MPAASPGWEPDLRGELLLQEQMDDLSRRYCGAVWSEATE